MMRFLQRQRKSIRSGEFFKCHLCLLLIAAMLVAAALPNGVRESGPLDSVKRMGQTGGQEFCPDRKQTGTMVAAPNEERPEVEAAGRELSEAHVIETLRQKSAYRYRNVQQLRLLVWLLECGLAGLLGALFLLAGRERGQQWELIPSGRRIVAYIRRADGKKNGWLFLLCIKLQRKKCAKNKKEDVWASLKEKAGVKDGEHTQIA